MYLLMIFYNNFSFRYASVYPRNYINLLLTKKIINYD